MKTLGLDLGGTKIAAAVVEKGKIFEQRRVPTPRTGYADVLVALEQIAKDFIGDFPDIQGVGLGSPGPLNFDEGKVIFAPNIPGMNDVPIAPDLSQRIGLRVVLENDANAAGYAEHRYGAARDMDTSVYITISTGIGGGIFIGDTVLRGAQGLAGEIGHITLQSDGPLGGDGHYGTWEALAAGRSIARDGSYVYGQDMRTEEVFERAQLGEFKAQKIIDNAARHTGIGIANLHKIINPAGFVIGGGMSQVGDYYLDKIRASVEAYTTGYPPVTICVAELGTDAGVIGAASVALPKA